MRDIVITLRSIKSTSNGQDTELLPAPEFVYIDSSIPEMVLPQAACDEFEKAFGLTHDETSGRYLLSPSAHEELKAKNPNITFTLTNSPESQRLVSITLPYSAFDLQLKNPLYNGTANSSAWFPLRRAPSEDTYALGRAFLQEAYLTVDYNSRTFNVSQALFPDPLSPLIVAVPGNLNQPGPENKEKPSDTDPSTPTSDAREGANNGGGLSTGALAGIIVAAVLGSLLLITLIFFCCPCDFCPALTICGIAGGAARRRKRKPKQAPVEIDGKRIEKNCGEGTACGQEASSRVQEVSGQDATVEIGGNPIMHPQEMEAELPPGIFTAAAAARQSHELAGSTPGGSTVGRPSAELEAGAGSSGLDISSETRGGSGSGGEGQYLSSGSENISSVSGESPASRNARMAEVSGDGIRPVNGPPTRLGRVEEVVSLVGPSTATGGWGKGAGTERQRPGNMRVDTSERIQTTSRDPEATDTAMAWTPQIIAPAQGRRWEGSDSDDIYGARR